MRRFGGGGHHAAGTCQVPYDIADDTLKVLVGGMNLPLEEYALAA
jgi:nanoRNase/pAp phosphatase (c-di-AMP/oligoRNAs hydrolase)